MAERIHPINNCGRARPQAETECVQRRHDIYVISDIVTQHRIVDCSVENGKKRIQS